MTATSSTQVSNDVKTSITSPRVAGVSSNLTLDRAGCISPDPLFNFQNNRQSEAAIESSQRVHSGAVVKIPLEGQISGQKSGITSNTVYKKR